MSACKYKRGEYCGLRNDIRAKSLEIKSYCIEGPCPDKKPLTNADRIRAMTDEELADFIGGIFTLETDVYGGYDPRTVVSQEPRVELRNREDALDWLKQEVDE